MKLHWLMHFSVKHLWYRYWYWVLVSLGVGCWAWYRSNSSFCGWCLQKCIDVGVFLVSISVDHTRVVLKDIDPNVAGSDYINANYISVILSLHAITVVWHLDAVDCWAPVLSHGNFHFSLFIRNFALLYRLNTTCKSTIMLDICVYSTELTVGHILWPVTHMTHQSADPWPSPRPWHEDVSQMTSFTA